MQTQRSHIRLTVKVLLILAVTAGASLWLTHRGGYTHVILITLDTTRRDHLTPYGYARPTTPNLAALAEDSVLFTTAYAAHTNTAPSHASMLTGLYPRSHGVVDNRHRLRPGVRTLAQHLGERGFRSGAYVTAVALKKKVSGLNRGFAKFDDAFEGGERLDQETFRRAHAFLRDEAHHRDPIFLFAHFFAPHYPYRAPGPWGGEFLEPGQSFRYRPKGNLARMRAGKAEPGELDEYITRYDGDVAYADHFVGQLLQKLRRHGYWNECLVIVVADHGETLDERPWVFDHGARLYEEQSHVPLIIRFPNGRHGGKRIDAPAHHVDILPTVLDYLGLDIPAGLGGQSLMPLIRGDKKANPSRPMFTQALPVPNRVAELSEPITKATKITSVRVGPLKLIRYSGTQGPVFQLFDLQKDPQETTNLAAQRQEVVEALDAEILAWLRATGAGEPLPPPALSPETEAALRSLGYVE